MAAGDIVVFDEFLEDLGLATHNLETGTIQMGLIVDETTPTAADATITWATYDEAQVTPGGNYSTGGPSIGGTYSQTSGTATFDVTDVDIEQNGSNPTDARWGIVYNNTAASDEAIAFLDLGANIDLSAGDFSVTWSGSGLFTIS